MMRTHLQHAHDFELAWCLLVAGVFRITVGEADLTPFDTRPNSVVFAILGMLRERRLLSVSLSKWGWRAYFKKSGVYGENWLPFYEAVRRKWTTDKEIISAVTKDPVLGKMLAARVTFLEDQIFDASTINISRRIFKKAARRRTQGESAQQDEKISSQLDRSRGSSDLMFYLSDYDS